MLLNNTRSSNRTKSTKSPVPWRDIGYGTLSAFALSLTLVIYSVSAYIEFLVLDELLPNNEWFGLAFAFWLAGAFCILKILMTVFLDVLDGSLLRGCCRATRTGLIIFSALCSLLFIGQHLNAPRLDALVESQTAQISADFDHQRHDLISRQRTEDSRLEKTLNTERYERLAPLDENIALGRQGMEKERALPGPDGNPIGLRYRDHERLMNNALSEREELGRQLAREASERKRELRLRHRDELVELKAQRASKLSGIDRNKLKHDDRAQSALMGAVELFNDSLGVEWDVLVLSLVLTLVLMSVIETSCIASVLAAQECLRENGEKAG